MEHTSKIEGTIMKKKKYSGFWWGLLVVVSLPFMLVFLMAAAAIKALWEYLLLTRDFIFSDWRHKK